jgi:hypothetical protein
MGRQRIADHGGDVPARVARDGCLQITKEVPVRIVLAEEQIKTRINIVARSPRNSGWVRADEDQQGKRQAEHAPRPADPSSRRRGGVALP